MFKPGLSDATAADKGVAVSAGRLRWKVKHADDTPPEVVIRMVRFIWMRRLSWDDRHGLHAGVLGHCLRAGFVVRHGARLQAVNPRRWP